MFDGLTALLIPEAERPVTPAETVDMLNAFVPALRDDDGLLDVAVAAYRHLGFAQAAMLRALAELHARFAADPLPGDCDRPGLTGREPLLDAAAELGPAAGLAAGAAHRFVDLAVTLTTNLPRTLEALASGRLDLPKVRVVADVAGALAMPVRGRVEDVALAACPTWTPERLRRRLTATAIREDPAEAERRRRRACARRRVDHWAEPDGTATLMAHGPVERTAAVFSVLDRSARTPTDPDDDRTLDQRRFDALYDIVVARSRGVAGELQVVIAADTLAGLDERPALLKGYGPITADAARLFAGDARWRRLVTDPWDGGLLDVGTRTYRPPKHLERFVRTRDITCIEPSCDRDARTAQLDHLVPYPHGPTAEGNIAAECTPAHARKTRGSASVEQLEPGVFEWTTRLGRRYVVDRRPLDEFTGPAEGRDKPDPWAGPPPF